MKIAFSTLGCPAWTFEQILDAGQRDGYDGIEFRGILQEIDLDQTAEFAPAEIARTRKRLHAAGLKAACLASSVQVVASTATEIDRHTAIAKAERYIEMAQGVGAPCVRVFCGEVPTALEYTAAIDRATETLRTLGEFAEPRGVTVVVETHDAFTRSEKLMELILAANHPAVQVLWDIHHPYRAAGESIQHSLRYLDGHIRSTHLKDSVLNPDGEGYTYVLLGQGDVPLREALRELKARNYDGYLTLEWEKRWHPQLEDPAVVFPQYISQVRVWLAEI